MRVDNFFQFGEIGGSRTAFQLDDAAHLVEAGANTVFHGEGAAQIERAFHFDRDALERDGKRGGISPIGDFLTGAERRQDELDGIWTCVRSAKARRFVDSQENCRILASLRNPST
jgi:hypothetical protein